MTNNVLIGSLTALGFVLAAWTYPVVAPMMDKVFNPVYVCKVTYFMHDGLKQERTSEEHKSQLQVGKYVNGFKVVQSTFVGDDFFGVIDHPAYTHISIWCDKKE